MSVKRRRRKKIFREEEIQWVKEIKRGSLIEEIGAKKQRYVVLSRLGDGVVSGDAGCQSSSTRFEIYNLQNRITLRIPTIELRARYKLLLA